MRFTPDDFKGDPYGHLTNQGAHGGLGASLLALLARPPLWAWLTVLAGYAVYEVCAHFYFDEEDTAAWDWPDSLDDLSNVAGGAAVLCAAFLYIGDFWTAWSACAGAFGIWGGALALSTWRKGRP